MVSAFSNTHRKPYGTTASSNICNSNCPVNSNFNVNGISKNKNVGSQKSSKFSTKNLRIDRALYPCILAFTCCYFILLAYFIDPSVFGANTGGNTGEYAGSARGDRHLPGVIVLGMHRSGTSLVTGLLAQGFGYETGGPLLKPKVSAHF